MNAFPCIYGKHPELCPYRQGGTGCKLTTHHLFYPRSFYNTKKLRRWRNRNENKIRVCAGIHQLFHLWPYLPVPPTQGLMDAAEAEDLRWHLEQRNQYVAEGGEDDATAVHNPSESAAEHD